MTKEKKQTYQDVEELRETLVKALSGSKFRLDCGHHFTPGYFLGQNIVIYNGKKPKIVCSLCAY